MAFLVFTFGDMATFWECVKFWLTPDIFSWFRGRYWEDQFARIRLGIWLILCGGLVFGEYYLITTYLVTPTAAP